MSTQTLDVRWNLMMRWMVATIIGWIAGMFTAIILSELVVNLVYPKEKNLMIGLCLGAVVALSQKIAVRQRFNLANSWVWGAMIGIGIPFVVIVFLNELGISGEKFSLLFLIAGGAICGLLQAPALRPNSSRVNLVGFNKYRLLEPGLAY